MIVEGNMLVNESFPDEDIKTTNVEYTNTKRKNSRKLDFPFGNLPYSKDVTQHISVATLVKSWRRSFL